MARQLGAEPLQIGQLFVDGLDLGLVVEPFEVSGQPHDAGQHVVDLVGCLPFQVAVADRGIGLVVAGELVLVVGHRLLNVVQLDVELPGGDQLVERGRPVFGHFVGPANLANGDPQRPDLLAEPARQRQFRRPAAEAANQIAIGVDAVESAPAERADGDQQQADSHQQLIANRPADELHGDLPVAER